MGKQKKHRRKHADAPQQTNGLIHGLYVAPEIQIENVRRGNAHWGWGFTDADFAALPPPPSWPNRVLTCIVLVPYLETPEQTFRALWEVVSHSYRSVSTDLPAQCTITLWDNGAHPGRCLRWEVLDLDMYAGASPDCFNMIQRPHAGILAAAAHHKRWVYGMNGGEIPYVWLPGYRLRGKGKQSRKRVAWKHLGMFLVGGGSEVMLCTEDRVAGDPAIAIPILAKTV